MIKRFATKCWYMVVSLLVLGAILFVAGRLVAPLAKEYRGEIERLASRALGQAVTIAGFNAGWYLYGPRFTLRDVRLVDRETGHILLHFDEARVGIDLFKSIRNQRLEPGSIVIVGTGFTVLRRPQGTLSILGFAGGQAAQDSEATRDVVTAWLLQQPYIAFEESRFTWRDLTDRGRTLHFADVSLQLSNDGERHRLNGSALLPLTMGRRIDFAVDIKGNPLASNHWQGRLYAAGSGIKLKDWIPAEGVYQLGVRSGTADFEVWSRWHEGQAVRIEGQASAYDVNMVSAAANGAGSKKSRRTMTLDSLGGRFLWRPHTTGWQLNVDHFVLTRGNKMWLPTRIAVQVEDSEAARFQFASDRLHLDDVTAFLALRRPIDGPLGEALLALQPRGELRDIYVAHRGSKPISVYCRFQELSTRPWKQYPGVRGISGTIQGDRTAGSVVFNSDAAELHFTKLLRDFVPLNRIRARIAWQHSGDGDWDINARNVEIQNSDIEISVNAGLVLPGGNTSPSLMLTAQFDKGDVGQISRYLPVSKMRPGLVRWVDRALVSGQIRGGTVLFRGPLQAFPFDQEEGRFEVRFSVDDAILEYAKGWPRLEELEGDLVFDGRSLSGTISNGVSFHSEIDEARLLIKNLAAKPAILSVHGRAHGPTHDAVRYVIESPLNKHFGGYFENTKVTGTSKLDLELHLPLAAHGPRARVRGDLQMDDSVMLLAGGDVDIRKINGMLHFTDSGLKADGIKAQIMGLPAMVSIHEEQQGREKLTLFSATGHATTKQYATLVDFPQLFDRLHGATDWQASLRVPRQSNQDGHAATLTVTSLLDGVSVVLPPPLGKIAGEKRNLVIDTALPRTFDTPTRIQYGNQFQAVLAFRKGAAVQLIDRGELRFGGQAALLPGKPGLRIAGTLDYFSLPAWQGFIDSFENTPETGSGSVVNALDVHITRGLAYGGNWDQVELQAVRRADAWSARVNSKQLVGSILVPHMESRPLRIDLERLVIEEDQQADKEPDTDPRELRPARIRSKHLYFRGADLGKLDLAASRRHSGLHIDSLQLISPASKIAAHGDWVVVNGRHSSSFDIKIDTRDMGVLLANFGYPRSIEGGQGEIAIIALWPGAPSDYAVAHLDGTVLMEITDGRLLEVEPGAGRFFGLLSLQTLPRRLTLDFSDLFQKGFGFEELRGEFSIRDGNAYTDNLFMEGPPARIEVKGRIGLATEDFDERVTVTPHVTSSLPIAGAIAGGPGVGAAILFMQKILKPKIDKMTRYHYRVTGAWDNPVITREQT